MVKINNQEVMKKLAETANIQIATDRIPSELADKIVPTFEANPLLTKSTLIIKSGDRTTTGSATIYTTDPDKDFYITSLSLSFSKDATCDAPSTNVALAAVINKETVNPLRISVITLTAQSAIYTENYRYPIKVDRGSAITFAGVTFTIGTLIRSGVVKGFYVQPST